MTNKTCTVVGCDDEVSGRGFCSKHYQRWVNNGDPLIVKRRAKQAEFCEKSDCGSPGYMRGLCLPHYRELQKSEHGPCSVEGCETPWTAKKMCSKHWFRWMRTGSTDDPKPVHRSCSVEKCDEQVDARELCHMHYRNWRKYGTTEAPPKPEKVWLPCIQDGCSELASRKNGMCNRHYRKTIEGRKLRCVIDDCDKPISRGKLCRFHGNDFYQQIYKTYNVTRERYDTMLEEQGGCCAICRKTPEEAGISRLVIDHDHKCCPTTPACGKCVRGLLCHCNRMIGMANDNPEILRAAIAYLAASESGTPSGL